MDRGNSQQCQSVLADADENSERETSDCVQCGHLGAVHGKPRKGKLSVSALRRESGIDSIDQMCEQQELKIAWNHRHEIAAAVGDHDDEFERQTRG